MPSQVDSVEREAVSSPAIPTDDSVDHTTPNGSSALGLVSSSVTTMDSPHRSQLPRLSQSPSPLHRTVALLSPAGSSVNLYRERSLSRDSSMLRLQSGTPDRGDTAKDHPRDDSPVLQPPLAKVVEKKEPRPKTPTSTSKPAPASSSKGKQASSPSKPPASRAPPAASGKKAPVRTATPTAPKPSKPSTPQSRPVSSNKRPTKAALDVAKTLTSPKHEAVVTSDSPADVAAEQDVETDATESLQADINALIEEISHLGIQEDNIATVTTGAQVVAIIDMGSASPGSPNKSRSSSVVRREKPTRQQPLMARPSSRSSVNLADNASTRDSSVDRSFSLHTSQVDINATDRHRLLPPSFETSAQVESADTQHAPKEHETATSETHTSHIADAHAANTSRPATADGARRRLPSVALSPSQRRKHQHSESDKLTFASAANTDGNASQASTEGQSSSTGSVGEGNRQTTGTQMSKSAENLASSEVCLCVCLCVCR